MFQHFKTIIQLEQAQKTLENTCRQNENMMEQLEKSRLEEQNRRQKGDDNLRGSLQKFFRVDAEIQEVIQFLADGRKITIF